MPNAKFSTQLRVVRLGGLDGDKLSIQEVNFIGNKPTSVSLYEGRGALEWDPSQGEDHYEGLIALMRALQAPVIDAEKLNIPARF